MVPGFDYILNQYSQVLYDSQRLYADAAWTVLDNYGPHRVGREADQFTDDLINLHRGLAVKIFSSIAGLDRIWSREEEALASVLIHHLWQQRMTGRSVQEAIKRLNSQAQSLEWSTLVGPFRRFKFLHHAIPELETLVVRMGNLIAKADGQSTSSELQELKQIQNTIFGLLRVPAEDSQQQASPDRGHSNQAQATQDPKIDLEFTLPAIGDQRQTSPTHTELREEKPTLEEAQKELEELVGMATIKSEIQTLINVLKLQGMRTQAGLPVTKLSLHMAFTGNPGTGKTTVARILGKIFGAMGILSKGHLVEVDRSGLVAEYAGQTGPKCNRVIDQALDGVLFIDEAYSLCAESGEDPYGAEAVQTLLKRMEDDRDRLVVILAGYPDEMERMIRSNPGLTSRIGRTAHFGDYSPGELGQIFYRMCQHNHYTIEREAFARLLLGLAWLHGRRDRHFGNGRLVRNLFEGAIRQLANRVVLESTVDNELLTRFMSQDLAFPDIPADVFSQVAGGKLRFQLVCPFCQKPSTLGQRHLGRRVKCVPCKKDFNVELVELRGEATADLDSSCPIESPD